MATRDDDTDPNQVVASLSPMGPAGVAAQTGAAALSNFGTGSGVGFQSYQSPLPQDFATGPGFGMQSYVPPTETPPWPAQILQDNPELPTDPNFENAFISPVHLSNDQANTVLAQLDEDSRRNAGDAIRQQYPPRAVPPIGQTPQTPENMIRHAIGAFTNPLMLMALVGGALTKQGARGALAAGTGVLQGLNEGNLQKAYLQNQKFRNSIKGTAAAEGTELADINAVLNSSKSMEEQIAMLDTIAQQHNDPTLSQMARQNFGQLPQFVAGRQKVLDGLHKSTRGLSKTQERLEKDGGIDPSQPDPQFEIEAQREAAGLPIGGRFSTKDQRRISGRANYIRKHPEQLEQQPKPSGAGTGRGRAAELPADWDFSKPDPIFEQQAIAHAKGDPRAAMGLYGADRARVYGRGKYLLENESEKLESKPGTTDLATRRQEFGAKMRAAQTAGNIEGRLTEGLERARGTIPVVIAWSEKVDRTEYPRLNKIWLATKEALGDVPVIRFKISLNTLKAAYASAMTGTAAGGATTVDAMKRADDILTEAYNKGQIRGGVAQMETEMRRELENVQRGVKTITRGAQPLSQDEQAFLWATEHGDDDDPETRALVQQIWARFRR